MCMDCPVQQSKHIFMFGNTILALQFFMSWVYFAEGKVALTNSGMNLITSIQVALHDLQFYFCKIAVDIGGSKK